jgi:hypothetical protein
MKVIQLEGDHYTMGQQHARQVRDLRPRLVRVLRERLKQLGRYEAELGAHLAELTATWEAVARSTLDMLRGMADGFDLEWEPFFRYSIAAYLEDRLGHPAAGEGCTVWAASGPITRRGRPILAKNRDTQPVHRFLPCLARAHSISGYRYAYLTSAGSPAVFSSGMNEVGLAVADTHVISRCVGPGVARYSVMMEILEHHSRVESALDYLRQTPHMGDGTLSLVDRAGDMAVFEAGRGACSVLRPERGFVVSTNHFCGAQLRDCWLEREPGDLQGNSQKRYARVTKALDGATGEVDTAWAQALMADHGGRRPSVAERKQSAICRHPRIDPRSQTISSVVYLPQEGRLLFADGRPCRTPFHAWTVV